MKLLVEIFSVYALYAFGATVLIWRHATKDRGPTVVVAWLAPALMIAAFIEGTFRLLFRKRPKVRPCPVGLDEAELVVEKRRQKMFGGELSHPHFASDWARLYGVTLEEEAERVQKIARKVFAHSYA
jgi:hypothetical protein